ncbi:MAG: TIGR02678 family protein [Gaiellaceae bacterium]
MRATTLELREQEELRQATRALLREPFVGADDPTFPLVRRHEAVLARRLAALWGYQLDVTPGFARLYKRPTDAGLRRWLRIPPGSASGRERPRDEWPRLDRRRATLLPLTMAALERSGQQTVLGELAHAVAEAGGRCEPPLEIDFDRRPERLAFADVLDLLCHWAVLRLDDGSRASFFAREPGDDEALFTIDRKRLGSLLRDPFCAITAQSLDDLTDDRYDYAPTDEGQVRRIRHRLARMLTEDPVLYIDRLTEEERAYFHRQRAYLEDRVGDYTGLVPERRAEGTACIEPERMLTDLPFPANSTRKQAALLLCDVLARRAGEDAAPLAHEELRAAMHALVERHGASWNRRADDPVEVESLLDDALGVLAGLDLVERPEGGVRPLPLCGRFRDPRVSRPTPED